MNKWQVIYFVIIAVIVILMALTIDAKADTVCIKTGDGTMICTDDDGNEEFVMILERRL